MKILPALKWPAVLALALAASLTGTRAADDCIDISQIDPALNAKVDFLEEGTNRCGNSFKFKTIPKTLKGLPCISVKRGAKDQAGTSYTFVLTKPATVYLFVMENGKPSLPDGWELTPMQALWGFDAESSLLDAVYSRHFEAGEVVVPAHDGQSPNFGVPHLCVVDCE